MSFFSQQLELKTKGGKNPLAATILICLSLLPIPNFIFNSQGSQALPHKNLSFHIDTCALSTTQKLSIFKSSWRVSYSEVVTSLRQIFNIKRFPSKPFTPSGVIVWWVPLADLFIYIASRSLLEPVGTHSKII